MKEGDEARPVIARSEVVIGIAARDNKQAHSGHHQPDQYSALDDDLISSGRSGFLAGLFTAPPPPPAWMSATWTAT